MRSGCSPVFSSAYRRLREHVWQVISAGNLLDVVSLVFIMEGRRDEAGYLPLFPSPSPPDSLTDTVGSQHIKSSIICLSSSGRCYHLQGRTHIVFSALGRKEISRRCQNSGNHRPGIFLSTAANSLLFTHAPPAPF
jgi:hypothetical protein